MVDLKKLINNTSELKLLAAQLRAKINRSKQDVDEFFRLCGHPVCRELEDKYYLTMQTFSISSKIDSLPHLSPIVDKIQYLLDQDIVKEVRKGKDKLDVVNRQIQKIVNEVLPAIRSRIAHADRLLNENVDKVSVVIAHPIKHIHSIQKQIGKSKSFLAENEIYFHYIGVFSCITLFSILISYLLGLLCTICSDRPTRYNYNNRSKKAECFFYGGTAIFLLSFTFLLSLSTVSFSTGGLSDRSLCYYLRSTSDSNSEKLFNSVQEILEYTLLEQNNEEAHDIKVIMDQLKDVKVVDILNRCHRNQSLFNVLQMKLNQNIVLPDGKMLNLSEIITFKERVEVEIFLKKLLDKVDIDPSNIVLLTRDGQELVKVLQDTPLETLNFSSYAKMIRHSITPINLEIISRHLEEESSRLPENEIDNVARLRNIAMDLKSASHLITLITNKIENLTKNAEMIERKSHYNGKGMRKTLQALMHQAKEAQNFIQTKGRDEIKKVLASFIDDVSRLITQYTNHVEYRVSFLCLYFVLCLCFRMHFNFSSFVCL